MNVLVDTSVWSLALRRHAKRLRPSEIAIVEEWASLVREGRVAIVGPIRQEILSGVRDPKAFDTLRNRLAPHLDLPLETADYEDAARAYNECRSAGVTGSAIDLLLCAVARRRRLPVFTIDSDFDRYSRILELTLHVPRPEFH